MCARADRSERVEVQVQVEARGSRHVFFALGLTAAQLSSAKGRRARGAICCFCPLSDGAAATSSSGASAYFCKKCPLQNVITGKLEIGHDLWFYFAFALFIIISFHQIEIVSGRVDVRSNFERMMCVIL